MGYNREFEINEEQVAEFLNSAVNSVKTEENVDILADLSKLFKKNVSLSVRKYVTAYLLKEALRHSHSYGKSSRHQASQKYNNTKAKSEYKQAEKAPEAAAEVRVHHERVQIDPENATSIFVSIGKNRRVYPRDLVGLLIGVAGLDRERIGDIKVLANYSFVQLYTEDAQGAIDKLDGYEYRGRKLAVSFSRQKGEGDEDSAEENIEAVTSFAADGSLTDAEMAAEDAAAYAAAEKAAADKEPFGM